MVGYFAFIFAYDSFVIGEISASTVGLPHRWIIKSVLVFGLIVAGLSGLAVWIQSVLVIFGPPDLRFDLKTLKWQDDKSSRRIKLEPATNEK